MICESYRFYRNLNCEYFPCHDTDNPEEFNCIFCHCPLYALGEDCGGNCKYTEDGIKDCSECIIPHSSNSYDYITEKEKELINKVKK